MGNTLSHFGSQKYQFIKTLETEDVKPFISQTDKVMMSCGRRNGIWLCGCATSSVICVAFTVFIGFWIAGLVFTLPPVIFPTPPPPPPTPTVAPKPTPIPVPTPPFNFTNAPTPPTPGPTIITEPPLPTLPPVDATPTVMIPNNVNATGIPLGPANVFCDTVADCYNITLLQGVLNVTCIPEGYNNGTCHITKCAMIPGVANFSDCNAYAIDGCERNLFNDTNNCGFCQNVCVGQGATNLTCLNSTCQTSPGSFDCLPGFADCYTSNPYCETYLPTSVFNCGSCDINCYINGNALLNITGVGVWTCMNSTCIPLACEPGYYDCDNDISNGCNDVLFENDNCGICGNVCNTTYGCCSYGVCEYSAGFNRSIAQSLSLNPLFAFPCIGSYIQGPNPSNPTIGDYCEAKEDSRAIPDVSCCVNKDCTSAGLYNDFTTCLPDPALPSSKICSLLPPTPAPTPIPIVNAMPIFTPIAVNFSSSQPFQFGFNISNPSNVPCTQISLTITMNSTIVASYLSAPWNPPLPVLTLCSSWNATIGSSVSMVSATTVCFGSYTNGASYYTTSQNTISFSAPISQGSTVLTNSAICLIPSENSPSDIATLKAL